MQGSIKFLIWVALFATHFYIHSQDLKNLKNYFELKNTDVIAANGFLPQKLTEDNLYILLNNYTDTIAISKINLNTNQITVLKFELFGKKTIEFINDFDFRNDSAIVLSYNKLYLFKLDSGEYKLTKTINMFASFDNCYFNNDKINVLKCYNHHSSDAKFAAGMIIYNLNLEKQSETIFKTDAIAFTHFVGKYIDFHHGIIVLANALLNKFVFYNKNGIAVDSVGDFKLINDGISNVPINYHFNKNSINPKDTIYKIQKFDEKINRIQKVYFINDSSLIYVKKLKQSTFEAHYLSKLNKNWMDKLLVSNLKNFSWKYSTQIHFFKNKIYFIDLKFKKNFTENYLIKNPCYYLYSYDFKIKPK